MVVLKIIFINFAGECVQGPPYAVMLGRPSLCDSYLRFLVYHWVFNLGQRYWFFNFFLNMNTHSSLICNSQRLETIQMFSTRWKGKQTATALYNEDHSATKRNVLWTHSAMTLCGVKGRKTQTPHESTHTELRKCKLAHGTKSRLWMHGDGKEKGWGSYWWKQETLGSDRCSYYLDCGDILKGVKHVKCIKWNTVSIKFTIYQL